MQTHSVTAVRLEAHGTRMACKQAALVADTDAVGRADAFNPVELLLAALAACIVKGTKRVAAVLRFAFRRLDLLHENVRKYGTISNTLAAAVPLTGRLARAASTAAAAD